MLQKRIRANLPAKVPIWLHLGLLLLIFSELVVWQAPTGHSLPRWIALAAIYVALAAIMLDLAARLRANEVFSLLMLAGLYGLLNGTLISHITARDLPFSLVVRPLAAQPLAFLLALAAYQMLASGRATGPLDLGLALVAGLVWGVWMRWFPIISDEPIPTVDILPALSVTGFLLVLALAARYILPPAPVRQTEDSHLMTPLEWALMGGILGAALAEGVVSGDISGLAAALTVMLGGYLLMMLAITRPMRRDRAFLRGLDGAQSEAQNPNPAAWLVLVIPFLIAGWIGHELPGSGDSSVQSDLLIAALTAFGVVWLPAVSIVTGVRSFVQLSREGM